MEKYYRHFKGNVYRVLHIAKHSDTLEDMFVYQAMYGERGIWVRPLSMFEEVIERDGKTIISDFSALKGKVTFSEKTPDTKLSAKVSSAPTSKPKDSENGLIIESAYGEFAVTDKAEIASLKEAKVKAKKSSMASKLAKSAVSSDGSLTVDLHIEAIPGGTSVPKGQQLQFQMDTFRKVIRENISHRGRKITFIHGIGDGILKAAIRKELDEVLALRCSYLVGDPAITVVSIK